MVWYVTRLYTWVLALRISLPLRVKNPTISMLFWSDFQKLIFHIPSKLRRNYAIRCTQFLRFQWWYIHPNPCNIDGDMITTRIFTGFGRSVHRVTWRDFWHCLECRTSGLVIMESIRVLGPSFNSQVLLKIAGSHIGCNLFGPYLLFYCMDSSQIWYRWKGIFEENPTPYVTKDEDYSLWKTSAITEIAPLGSF